MSTHVRSSMYTDQSEHINMAIQHIFKYKQILI